jgi:DNA mismatch endonuclease (patch repair protein)
MDIFSPEKRSEIMAKVHYKNSRAELLAFSYLRKNKIHFQKHYKRAPGNPDIALPRKKKAVFIDGDYWHGRYPDKVTQNEFWINKISKNISRDREVLKELSNLGWDVLRVWESDINRKRTQKKSLDTIKNFLLE